MNKADVLLREIALLSKEFGTPAHVKGGGGNTSCKTADTLWVKPSGLALADMTPATFVALDREKLAACYSWTPPAEASAREEGIKNLLMGARLTGQGEARPSVESLLHDLLEQPLVVHTHMMLMNGLTCARGGRAAVARLFPEALWVPYTDPGYILSMDVRTRISAYREKYERSPSLLILENHGLFVAGADASQIRTIFRSVAGALETAYRQAGVPIALRYGSPTLPSECLELHGLFQSLWGGEAAHIASSAPFAVATGPLTPDHMVYGKALPFTADLTREQAEAFRKKNGFAPRVVSTTTGVFGLGKTAKAAQLALELAQDGSLIAQLSSAFGGVQYMSPEARRFIESWEVESYREQQSLREAQAGGAA